MKRSVQYWHGYIDGWFANHRKLLRFNYWRGYIAGILETKINGGNE
jgi:hypothetical protein